MSKDRLLSDKEALQRLYDLFGQNFLDGDKPTEWKAATINASCVKEYIEEFVAPLIDTQKRLYAESEKIQGKLDFIEANYPTLDTDSENQDYTQKNWVVKEVRSELRAEQRKRIK